MKIWVMVLCTLLYAVTSTVKVEAVELTDLSTVTIPKDLCISPLGIPWGSSLEEIEGMLKKEEVELLGVSKDQEGRVKGIEFKVGMIQYDVRHRYATEGDKPGLNNVFITIYSKGSKSDIDKKFEELVKISDGQWSRVEIDAPEGEKSKAQRYKSVCSGFTTFLTIDEGIGLITLNFYAIGSPNWENGK